MSNLIGLAGLSNSGKSTSLKYLNSEETFIISCTNKQLQIPGFRKKYKKISAEGGKLVGNWLVTNDYAKIQKIMKIVSDARPEIKVLVIDDANYLLSNATFKDALIKGYEKFTIQAKNYYDLIEGSLGLRDDLTVIFISHIENSGTEMDPQWRLYTTGKMLTNAVNLDGLFSYLLYSERYINDGDEEVKYRIKTRTDGNDTCRSVSGCFSEKYVEPNMKQIIDTINAFEGLED